MGSRRINLNSICCCIKKCFMQSVKSNVISSLLVSCVWMAAYRTGDERGRMWKMNNTDTYTQHKDGATGAGSDLCLKKGICEWWRWSSGPLPPPAGLFASAEASWGFHCAGASWSAHAGSDWAWPWSSSYTAYSGSSRHHPPLRFRAAAGAVGGGEREGERGKESERRRRTRRGRERQMKRGRKTVREEVIVGGMYTCLGSAYSLLLTQLANEQINSQSQTCCLTSSPLSLQDNCFHCTLCLCKCLHQ